MSRKTAGSITALAVVLMFCNGCGTTMTVKDVGRGMQIGSVANGSWLAPLVWGTGFFLEQIGEAVEAGEPGPKPLSAVAQPLPDEQQDH